MTPNLLALAAGGLLPLALAPFDLWPLAFLSLSIWFYLLHTSPERALLLSWLFGVGKYAVGASWIFVSIHEHGHAPVPLAVALVALFVAGMALFPLATGWLFRILAVPGLVRSGLWFVVCYGFTEWLLGWFLTGFPWLYTGYALLDTQLSALAPLGGVLLLNLLVAVIAVALVWFAVACLKSGPGHRRLLIAAPFIVLVPWLVGSGLSGVSWTQTDGSRSAVLVQGNIPQSEKWLPENRSRIVDTYLALTEPHWGADLIVWPEAAITLFQHEAEPLLEALDARGRTERSGLILGVPALERSGDGSLVFRNTALGVGLAEGRYVKRRLVPFGEYVPLEGLLRGLIGFFDLPMSRAEPGPWEQPLLALAGKPLQMAICYEIVYPDLVRTPPSALLLTISNDSWFGDSLGPRQHLQMARMRALENGRWLLRATNNGITAIVAPDGRISGRLAQFEAGVLQGEFQTMRGLTPYGRFGNAPFLLLLISLAAVLLGLRKRAE